MASRSTHTVHVGCSDLTDPYDPNGFEATAPNEMKAPPFQTTMEPPRLTVAARDHWLNLLCSEARVQDEEAEVINRVRRHGITALSQIVAELGSAVASISSGRATIRIIPMDPGSHESLDETQVIQIVGGPGFDTGLDTDLDEFSRFDELDDIVGRNDWDTSVEFATWTIARIRVDARDEGQDKTRDETPVFSLVDTDHRTDTIGDVADLEAWFELQIPAIVALIRQIRGMESAPLKY